MAALNRECCGWKDGMAQGKLRVSGRAWWEGVWGRGRCDEVQGGECVMAGGSVRLQVAGRRWRLEGWGMRGQSVRVGLYTDASHLHLQAVIAPDHELNDVLPTDDATSLTATH